MKHRREDVEQVVEVLLHEDYRDGVADPVTFAERVIDAVGPSLEKRGAVQALREAAADLDRQAENNAEGATFYHSTHSLRGLADEIEAQS